MFTIHTDVRGELSSVVNNFLSQKQNPKEILQGSDTLIELANLVNHSLQKTLGENPQEGLSPIVLQDLLAQRGYYKHESRVKSKYSYRSYPPYID